MPLGIRKFKALFKPIVLLAAPRIYYHRVIRQNRTELNVNSLEVDPVMSIAYNPQGKYPTMYIDPPSFYMRRKESMHQDEDGIPMLCLHGTLTYHPVYMIQYALSEYGFFVSSHDYAHFSAAQKIADWLLAHQDPDTGCWYYPYDYVHEFTEYHLDAPWASAMAQGQAISLLTRIHHETGDERYLAAAVNATSMLNVPVSSGGLAAELWGHTVFEEYPTIPYSLTLNGFMFCALGLYDLCQAVSDEKTDRLWASARSTLEFMIPFYDGDLISTYCLSYITTGNGMRKWSEGYHSIHIKMLQCFESFMPNPTFEFYIKRWAKQWGLKING